MHSRSIDTMNMPLGSMSSTRKLLGAGRPASGWLILNALVVVWLLLLALTLLVTRKVQVWYWV
jgi:hypothetical protein